MATLFEDEHFAIASMASAAGASRVDVIRLARAGGVPFQRIGTIWGISRQAVHQMLTIADNPRYERWRDRNPELNRQLSAGYMRKKRAKVQK